MRAYADSLEKTEIKLSSFPVQGKRFCDGYGDGDQGGNPDGQQDSASVTSNRGMNDYRQTGGALSNNSRGTPSRGSRRRP